MRRHRLVALGGGGGSPVGSSVENTISLPSRTQARRYIAAAASSSFITFSMAPMMPLQPRLLPPRVASASARCASSPSPFAARISAPTGSMQPRKRSGSSRAMPMQLRM